MAGTAPRTALFLALLAPPLAGAVEVRVVVAGQAAAEPARGTLRAECSGRAGERREPIETAVPVPGSARLDLPAGQTCRLSVAAPGFWSPEVIADGVAPVIRVHRTGEVLARLRPPRGAEPLREVEIRFEPAASPGVRPTEAPKGTVACAVSPDGVARCEIPAARLDLRLGSRGFAAEYRWGVMVEAGRALDLGAVDLHPGASIVGRLETAEGVALDPSARIELTPLSAGELALDQEPRLRGLAFEGRPGEHGFFQLRGVPPGSYAVEGTMAGRAPARRQPIEVMEGLETHLPHPLLLERPVSFSVVVSPPIDPFGRPWRLTLARGDLTSFQGRTGTDGRWEVRGVAPGDYALVVRSGRDTTWLEREVTVEAGAPPLDLEVPLVEVEGTVTLAGEPLRATLWFGGLHGARRVRIDSGEDGEIHGFLPHQGTWPVEIVLDAGGPGQSIDPVEVRCLPGQRVARLAIEVPDTRLTGIVVDEAGSPVAGATVTVLNVQKRAVPSLATTDSDGRFGFRGLATGGYVVQATRDDAASDSVATALAEDGTGRGARELRLVIRESVRLTGRIVSPRGPVPGAAVVATPEIATAGFLQTSDVVTDPLGSFELRVPAGTAGLRLLVMAPGFAARLLRLPIQPGTPLEVAVDPFGGTLHLDLAALDAYEAAAGRPLYPFVTHAGADARPHELARWAQLHVAPASARSLSLPMMEPGFYSLCLPVPGASPEAPPVRRCAEGTLAPNGELTLVLPQGEPASARAATGETAH